MALIVIHLWGKFWMAAWRGRRAMTWITGVVAFWRVHRGVLHRVPVAAELRLAVDRHQRQGRVQRRRRGGVLQRDELRPDAALAHRADPDHPGRAHRRARAAGPDARRQPPAAEPGGCAGATGPAARPPGSGRRSVARPDPPVRHPQGGHDRRGDHDRPGAADGRTAVLARRAAGHGAKLGQGRSGGLPGHCGHRTGRNGVAASYGPPYNHGTGRGAAGRARSTGRSWPASPSPSMPRRRSCSRRCPS